MTNEIMWYHPIPISLMISGKRCDVSIFDPGRLISKVICDPGLDGLETVCFTLWNRWNFGLRDVERCWEDCSKTGSDDCPRLRNETMLSLAWKGQNGNCFYFWSPMPRCPTAQLNLSDAIHSLAIKCHKSLSTELAKIIGRKVKSCQISVWTLAIH